MTSILPILSELTDQDLEKIGVRSLGHRRQLLRAIATLNDTSVTAAPAPAPPTAVAMAAPAVETAGERRHVTVMFCDLVDSTGIATRLDMTWRSTSSPACRSRSHR
jgi:class 3 adenylate cyclase